MKQTYGHRTDTYKVNKWAKEPSEMCQRSGYFWPVTSGLQ